MPRLKVRATAIPGLSLVALRDVSDHPRVPRRRARRRAGMPSTTERTWSHPAELPKNFSTLPSPAPERPVRPAARYVLYVAIALFASGTWALSSLNRAPATSQSLPSHVARTISDVPNVGKRVAATTLELVVNVGGHVSAGGSIVVDHGRLAVTTMAIPTTATITGSSLTTARVRARWLGRDTRLGLSYVALADSQPVSRLHALPASEGVLALSPFFRTVDARPSIAFASTVLSDPLRTTDGDVVSYLTATSPTALHASPGTVAVDDQGGVVAIYGQHNQWYAARYLERVADAFVVAPGCHARLGVQVVNAEGGGVYVASVSHAGPLRAGDVITDADATTLDAVDALRSLLYVTPGGHPVRLTIRRGASTQVVFAPTTCQP